MKCLGGDRSTQKHQCWGKSFKSFKQTFHIDTIVMKRHFTKWSVSEKNYISGWTQAVHFYSQETSGTGQELLIQLLRCNIWIQQSIYQHEYITTLPHRLFSLTWTSSARSRLTLPLPSGDRLSIRVFQQLITTNQWLATTLQTTIAFKLDCKWGDFWRWFREGSTEPITNNQHYQISHFAHDDEYVDTILRCISMMIRWWN